jgi:hypothetical protein
MRTLRTHVPKMRMQVQGLLGRLDLNFNPTHRSTANQTGEGRRTLGLGVYPEVEVRAPKIAWKGKIDILVVKESGCEIVDLKTGEFHESHQFQIQLYALLWSLDPDLNPTRRLANKLTLTYGASSVTVASLSAVEIDVFANDIINRTENARATLRGANSDAIISIEKCRYCSVRHLCADYWSAAVPAQVNENTEKTPVFCDCELQITDRHGPTSWNGFIISSNRLPQGTPILLRMAASEPDLRPNDQIRILDTQVTVPMDEEQVYVVTPTILTEIYFN